MHKSPLDRITVASPCHSDWRWMYGNDQVRFCGQCNLNVYNLSAMSREQAEDLIRRTEGRLCVRFYRRADGTILTQNCPRGLQAVKKKLHRLRTHVLGAALSFFSFFGFLGAYKAASGREDLLDNINSLVHPTYEVFTTGVMDIPYEPASLQKSESWIREKAIFKVTPFHHGEGAGQLRGSAVVKVTISETGEVTRAEFLKGNPLLKGLAEGAASRWKFEPMFPEGLPARVESVLTFHFGR